MKVNKIFKTAAVALCSMFVLSGCIKETLPMESAITESQLAQSGAGLESMMKAIPKAMAFTVAASYDHSDFGYHSVGLNTDFHALIAFPCTRSDRGGNPYYSRLQSPNYGFDMGPNGGYTHYLWYNYYPWIKSANDVIGAAGTEEMQEFRAISKTFRALFYLDLARYYEGLEAEAPELADYKTELAEVYGLTVPWVDENTTEAQAKANPRCTREELFRHIFDDLAEAVEIMSLYEIDPETGESELEATVYGTSPTYPTLAAVYGLYARAYLWLGGFEANNAAEDDPYKTGEAAYREAARYARLAIETSKAPITTEQEWLSVTNAFNTVIPSWLWATVQSSDTVMSNLYAFAAHMCPEAAYGYGPLACHGVSSTMYDRIHNTDFRKKVIVGPNTTYDDFKNYTTMSRDEWEALAYMAPYTSFKFRPFGGERNDYMRGNAVNLPIMRVEELYFIEMEATSHFDEAEAQKLLYTFMATRDSKYFYIGSDLAEEIVFQKQVEFWGEGQVLFDMKRLNMGVNTTDANYPSGMLFKSEGRLPWWNMSIPSGEYMVNKGIKNDQIGPDPSRGLVSQDAM